MTSDTHRNGGSPGSGADPSSTSSTWNHPVPSGTVIWPGNSNSCTSSEFECKIGDILLACSMFLPQGQSFLANFLYPKIGWRDNKKLQNNHPFLIHLVRWFSRHAVLSSRIFPTNALRRGFEMIDAAAKKLRRTDDGLEISPSWNHTTHSSKNKINKEPGWISQHDDWLAAKNSGMRSNETLLVVCRFFNQIALKKRWSRGSACSITLILVIVIIVIMMIIEIVY